MTLSDFQTKKFTHLFRLYDADNNGEIDKNDYERRTQYLTEQRGFELDSPDYLQIRQRIMGDWEQLVFYVDADANDVITLAEFLDYSDYVLGSDTMWQENADDTASFIIEVCDVDDDGSITLEEYGVFFKSYDLDDDQIQFAFEKLDADGDGLVTREELKAGLDQFGKSQNPDDAGNYMFGPLD